MPESSNDFRAFSMQIPSEFASFRQGMTTETSTGSAEARSGRGMVRGAILRSRSIASQMPTRVHRSTAAARHGAREITDQDGLANERSNLNSANRLCYSPGAPYAAMA